MKNTNIIDTQYLKQAAMPIGTLLAIFVDFLLAHAVFFMFQPATPMMLTHHIPDPFGLGLATNPGEAMTLIPLTLALMSACMIRFSARTTPVGMELDAMKRMTVLRTVLIALMAFGLGGLFFYIVNSFSILTDLQMMAFGLLFGGLFATIAGLITGQKALRVS